MEKKELLYEGKAKKVFTTEDPDVLIVSYKDDATAFDGQKKGTIVGKGAINNRMTNHVFRLLEAEGVPTHLVEELNDRETAVKKVEIVPLEVIIRNFSAGSFAKKMGMEEGIRLKCPTLEFSYKNDDLHDPFINSYYAQSGEISAHHLIDLKGISDDGIDLLLSRQITVNLSGGSLVRGRFFLSCKSPRRIP